MNKKYLLGFALLCLGISGCSKEKSEVSGEKVKTIIISQGSKPKSLDPAMYNEIPSLFIVEQIFNTLFRIDPNGKIVPELAESYEYVTPLELVIKLKRGIKFHNGEELKANDVAFSVNRMLEKPATKVMLDAIDSVSIVDDYIVKIKLKESSAPLLYTLSYPLTSILNEKDTLSKSGNIAIDPLGTGPFKFDKWGDGEKIKLNSNIEYFEGKPVVDELVFRAITENTSRLAALETGEVDIATISPIDVQTVESSEELYAISYPTTSTEYLTINVQKYPLNNLDFRKAIHSAIDKQSIVDTVYMGKASVAKTIVNPTVFGSDQSVEGYPYNPEKAKEYINKSGVSGEVIKIMSNDNPVRLQAAQIIQANLKEVGINSEIETVEWGTYLQLTAQGQYDIFIGGWVSGTSDSDIVLFPLLHSSYKGGAGNRAMYENPKYDSLVELGRTSLEPEKRIEVYSKAQELLQEETPLIPLYYKNDNMGLSKKIKNFIPEPNTIHNFTKVDKE
ncbi:ABC transporter substrate-binding protein [uncultured Cetobacterium sp.]|uniref:ABC transporter substrate-binding protein n=1 Tax=uncultured Cetobacterium sp. TaxID=527638 RepID=UPI002601A998|nr:ABC transporter substrate-binding protein [uncultured Cetobacterium sp.]